VNRSNWDTFALLFLFALLVIGLAVAFQPFGLSPITSAGAGLGAVFFASLAALRLRRATAQVLVSGSIGLFAGAALGLSFVLVSRSVTLTSTPTLEFFRLVMPILGAYAGLIVGIAKADALPIAWMAAPAAEAASGLNSKLLDTSVLIDGRVADIVESGFMDGPLVVPRFVLHELQLVADSSDSARRARGRRGLDVVQQLQKLPSIQLEVSSKDFPATREVDLKLIELAKLTGAKIVTNDFNLNKLAQVQGVLVLNINELANALKPIVLPGELMRVFILKEGKEHNQGVAYLDDGTMVVVDNARRLISKTVDIVVTSVLQTTAGKMIFGRYDERVQSNGEVAASATSINR
jgi:uncharacterized protein YacL